MTKRMLIDASHAEETRVVVLDGTRLEDFDVETATKRQLKGNIYLAKVVRVEPSLQAAFVEYGGNRHGFLAFSEIHPDYYQIPVADRQRLIEMEAEEARREEEEADLELALGRTGAAEPAAPQAVESALDGDPAPPAPALVTEPDMLSGPIEAATPQHEAAPADSPPDADNPGEAYRPEEPDSEGTGHIGQVTQEARPPETIGGDSDAAEERAERRMPPRFMRNYKIQEVIRRRQILLVQVVKEERGTKGAALTTYLSLAGRFSVLMPNSPRGGGISRKITSATDRRRLKEITAELDIPRGMGLIVRTAGANRPKPEIRRDCEYLLRLWDDIREHTLKSVAPALIYEEASLIKRAIRDVYSRDVDEIQVDGEEGWRAAHEFMRMLMPSHAKKVQLWRDGGQPLFARYQVEAQLDGMLMPTVQLRSGGYLVINQAEALVAIDVNSGRSTRERGIEETALRTNMEAADEVARQLRLRDLAGLIVIDFIDMEAKKHNAMVERRLKEALKNDRARIQVGHISHFGLMEMSRQRLRPSLAETSFVACPHCAGTGHVRSTESAAIHVLRGIEDEGSKRRAAEIVVHVATPIALYLLNHKRERLHEIEQRYAMRVIIAADDGQFASQFRIERARPQLAGDMLAVITPDAPQAALPPPAAAVAEAESDEDEPFGDEEDEAEDARAEAEEPRADGVKETPEEAERRRKRRRRRRRGRREDMPAQPMEAAPTEAAEVPAAAEPVTEEPDEPTADPVVSDHIEGVPEHGDLLTAEEDAPNRRRGRRGGRRRRREPGDGELSPVAELDAEQPDLLPVYTGPTPANPFGGQPFDIFDVMDQTERNAASQAAERPAMLAIPEPPVAREAAVTEETVGVAGIDAPAEPLTSPPEDAAPAEATRVPTEPDAAAAEPAPTLPEATESAAPSMDAEGAPAQAAPEVAEAAEVAVSSAPDEPDSPEPQVGATAEEAVVAEPRAGSVTAEAVVAELVMDTVAARPTAATLVEAAPPPPVAANDVVSGPLVKPIVIGIDEIPEVEKKRGWWRR